MPTLGPVLRRAASASALLGVAALGAVAGMFARWRTAAHFALTQHQATYMWDDDNCTDHLDPINVVFHGTGGVAESVQRHADHH